jgi:hypothetical protein
LFTPVIQAAGESEGEDHCFGVGQGKSLKPYLKNELKVKELDAWLKWSSKYMALSSISSTARKIKISLMIFYFLRQKKQGLPIILDA